MAPVRPRRARQAPAVPTSSLHTLSYPHQLTRMRSADEDTTRQRYQYSSLRIIGLARTGHDTRPEPSPGGCEAALPSPRCRGLPPCACFLPAPRGGPSGCPADAEGWSARATGSPCAPRALSAASARLEDTGLAGAARVPNSSFPSLAPDAAGLAAGASGVCCCRIFSAACAAAFR